MAEQVLLKVEAPELETVSAFNHVYSIQEGYVHVDVRPYLKHAEHPEPHADAQVDAQEILRMVRFEEMAGGQRPMRLFRVPTADETEAWKKAKEKGAAKGPDGRDRGGLGGLPPMGDAASPRRA